MRLVRGRAATPTVDRSVTATLLTRAGDIGEESFRAWTPHRQLAFGRRDTHAERYDEACAAARNRGYAVVERSVGGRAVAYTGSTIAFAHAVPLDDPRRGLTERYEGGVDGVVVALSELGVDARPGEPADSFCPGDHSVRLAAGGKLSGIAQRVQSGAALVAGCVNVTDRSALLDVLVPVYEALDVPFDPDSVGTLADVDGPTDPEPVCRALERAFLGDADDPAIELSSATDFAAD